MNTNSLKAHQLNIEFSVYPTMSARILAHLAEVKQATMQDIAATFGVPVHKVSGRFGSLVKTHKIEVFAHKKEGRYSYGIYRLVQPQTNK